MVGPPLGEERIEVVFVKQNSKGKWDRRQPVLNHWGLDQQAVSPTPHTMD